MNRFAYWFDEIRYRWYVRRHPPSETAAFMAAQIPENIWDDNRGWIPNPARGTMKPGELVKPNKR